MSEWISVEDEMPKHRQEVDIWIKINHGLHHGDEGRITNMFLNMLTGEFWRYSEFIDEVETIHISNVTHWMPLPKPPK